MNVSFNGLDSVCATFCTAEDVQRGALVKLSANGTVTACAADDVPIGVVTDVRGGYAGVQLRGYVVVKYSDTLEVGWTSIAADGSGGVKKAEAPAGRAAAVLDVDDSAKTAGILL